MSSLIEQAAKRLEQLRAAGVEIPDLPGDPPLAFQPPQPAPGWPSVAEPAGAALTESFAFDDAPPAVSKQVDLDLDTLVREGYLVPAAPRSHMADQYRVIKRPLIANAMGKGASKVANGNLIMMTSAMPGEGKSFTAVNLAMSIAAEFDHTVMLVDADVARPSVLRMLHMAEAPGLLDLLEGKAQMQDVLLRTNIDKLTILPSGRPHPKATELLASDAMRVLLDDMASRYPDRIIIFDSPPLLLTTESRVLATHMGQVVLVVHASKTYQADVEHALATIDACPIRMLLLNQARTSSKGGAYGYGYGYGYGGTSYGYGEYGYGYGYGGYGYGGEEAGGEPPAGYPGRPGDGNPSGSPVR